MMLSILLWWYFTLNSEKQDLRSVYSEHLEGWERWSMSFWFLLHCSSIPPVSLLLLLRCSQMGLQSLCIYMMPWGSSFVEYFNVRQPKFKYIFGNTLNFNAFIFFAFWIRGPAASLLEQYWYWLSIATCVSHWNWEGGGGLVPCLNNKVLVLCKILKHKLLAALQH